MVMYMYVYMNMNMMLILVALLKGKKHVSMDHEQLQFWTGSCLGSGLDP